MSNGCTSPSNESSEVNPTNPPSAETDDRKLSPEFSRIAAGADPFDCAGHAIAHEHIPAVLVSRAWLEIVGEAVERHEAAVGADIYVKGRTLTKLPVCVDVDSLHRLHLPVEHVDMISGLKLRMALDESLTARDERNESAVAADGPICPFRDCRRCRG